MCAALSSSGSARWVVASVPRVREVADPKCRCAGAVDRAGFTRRPAVPSRIRTICELGVGDELLVEGVGDPPLEAADRFFRLLARRSLAPVVVAAFGVETHLVTAAMWIMWLIRRFPARDSRCRFCSPEEASRGAVPVQDANRLRSAKRATSPTLARIRAATTAPTPWRSISRDPRAKTMAFSSTMAFLIFSSTAISSASSSARSGGGSCRRCRAAAPWPASSWPGRW